MIQTKTKKVRAKRIFFVAQNIKSQDTILKIQEAILKVQNKILKTPDNILKV